MIISKSLYHILFVLIAYLLVIFSVNFPITPYEKLFSLPSFSTNDFNQLYFPLLFTFITVFTLVFTFSKTEYLKIKSIQIYKTQFSFIFFIVPVVLYILILLTGEIDNIIYLQVFLIIQLLITFIQTIIVFYNYNNYQYISRQLLELSDKKRWNILKSIIVEELDHQKKLDVFFKKMGINFLLNIDKIENSNIDPLIQEIIIYNILKQSSEVNAENVLLHYNLKNGVYSTINNCLEKIIKDKDELAFKNICDAISVCLPVIRKVSDARDSEIIIDSIFTQIDLKFRLPWVLKNILNYIQHRERDLNSDLFQQILFSKIFDACVNEPNGPEMFISAILHNYCKHSKWIIDENEKMKCNSLLYSYDEVGFIIYKDTTIGLYEGDSTSIDKIIDVIGNKKNEYLKLKENTGSSSELLYQLFIRNISNNNYYVMQHKYVETDVKNSSYRVKRPIAYNLKSKAFIDYISEKNKELNELIDLDITYDFMFFQPSDLIAKTVNGELVHGYFFNDSYYQKGGLLYEVRNERKDYIEDAINKYEEFLEELDSIVVSPEIPIDYYYQKQQTRATYIVNNASKIINDNVDKFEKINKKMHNLDKISREVITFYNDNSLNALLLIENIINKHENISIQIEDNGLVNFIRVSKLLQNRSIITKITEKNMEYYDLVEYLEYLDSKDFGIYYKMITRKENYFAGTSSMHGLDVGPYTRQSFEYKYYQNINTELLNLYIRKYIEIYPEKSCKVEELIDKNRELKYQVL